MKHISLDSALLFALVIPFIMTYQIAPNDTSYVLFSLIFLGLLGYIVLDIMRMSEKLYFRLKQITLWLVIIMVLGGAFVSAVIVRHRVAPIFGVHDIILQQEAAIQLFIHGKNPYAETYFGTQLEQWHYSNTEVNPALYHFVMEPFYLLFAIPFYWLANHTIGYPDARIPLYLLFLSLLIMAAFLVKDRSKKLLFLTLLAFNPAMLGYTLEGRSDMFMYPFLFAGLYLLERKRYIWAGLPFALAFAVKQSVWPIFPFYIAFLYFKTGNVKETIKVLTPFFVLFILFFLPFFLWNQKAFLDSTVFYLSGSIEHSYPISGYGLGKLLNELGIIKDVHVYYPFWIWQVIIGIPLAVLLMRFLRDTPSVQKLIIVYGIFLFVYWYLSRYFNNSHLGYLSMVFITAYFWPPDIKK